MAAVTAPVDAPGAQVGSPWQGQPGVTETLGAIRERQRRVNDRGASPQVAIPAPGRRSQHPVPGNPAPKAPTRGSNAVDAPLPTTGTSFLSTNLGAESTFIPPDTTGAVGPSQIVVPLNGRFKIFDKAGTTQFNVTLDTFFTSVRNGQTAFDSKVEFDRTSNRWFVTSEVGGANNRIMIAVSSGPTLTDATSFSFFFFNEGTVIPARAADFADYPTLGVDANALYMGTNNFASGGTGAYTSSSAFVIRKSSLLSGGPIVVTGFTTVATGGSAGAYTPQGVENDDPTATEGYFIGVDNLAFSQLDIRRVTDPGGTPTLSGDLTLAVPSTTFPRTVPALGSTTEIDTNDDRLFDAMIARDPATGQPRLWTAHSIQVNTSGAASNSGGRDGARWYEIGGLAATPSLVQSGTLFDSAASSPDYYFFPSIAASGQGHAVLGSSIAGANRFAGVALAQRFSGESAGSLSPPVVAQAGAASYTLTYSGTRNRWGDYSQVSVDPNDNMTFWAFQEYVTAANTWGVRVIQVKAPPPASPASASGSVPTGQSSVNVTITGTATNGSGFYDPGSGFANRISAAVSGGVTVNSVTYTDPTHVTLDLNTTAASPGAKDVTITNPDGQPATGSGILTAASPQTLTVSTAGSGSGTVTGPGINCPGDCSEIYPDGTNVSLTSTAASGAGFAGFSGDCSGASCNLTMSANRSVTATFSASRTLTVSTAGSGSGTVTGPGINCPGDCSEIYPDGTNVSLTSIAASGASFAGFSGDCSGASCNLTMSANRSATATFSASPAPDTVPPETTIDKHPKKKTSKAKAKFVFHANEAGSRFACALSGKKAKKRLKAFRPCSSPQKYKKLKPGKYKFRVVATDAAGNVDPTAAAFKWKVVP